MQLPDESIEFNFTGLLSPHLNETWTPLAELQALHLLSQDRLDSLKQQSMNVRMQIASERSLTPESLKPNGSGFVDLPQKLLEQHRRKGEQSELGRVMQFAERLKSKVDRVLFVGVEEAHLGTRAILEALTSKYHNELPVKNRMGAPRMYICGNSSDNDALQELLDLLENTCVDPELKEERWGIIVVGRSNYPLETASTFRILRNELCRHYGTTFSNLRDYMIPIGDASGSFQDLCRAEGFDGGSYLTLPENVSLRFSACSPTGLLPAALMGLDLRAFLLGAAAMTQRFFEEPFERNPVLQFAAVNYLISESQQKPNRFVGVWSSKLEALGKWHEYLVSESLGRTSKGSSLGTLVFPRDLHTIGQRLLEGRRDIVLHQISVKSPHHPPIPVGMADHNEDDLNCLSRKTLPMILETSRETFLHSLRQSARPFSEIRLPVLSEHTLGQLMQGLMLATVAEAKLMGINPYGRPAFDQYQQSMMTKLKQADLPKE